MDSGLAYSSVSVRVHVRTHGDVLLALPALVKKN